MAGPQAEGSHRPTAAAPAFLQAWELPSQWSGRDDFVLLALGFGAGQDFLQTWQTWLKDPRRCQRLHFVALEAQPPKAAQLARLHGCGRCDEKASADCATDTPAAPGKVTAVQPLAAQLVRAWPPLTPNLHTLDFAGNRLRLTLGFGDLSRLLPQLLLQADAISVADQALAGAVQLSPLQMMKALARLARPGAHLALQGQTAALLAALKTAGFQSLAPPLRPNGNADTQAADVARTFARYAPRFVPRRAPAWAAATTGPGAPPAPPGAQQVLVIGAGLAGAATARALARLGREVLVFEADKEPGQQASGNAAGLFHGTLDAADSAYARLYRAASLCAATEYREFLSGAAGEWGVLQQPPAAAGTGSPGSRRAGAVQGLLRQADPGQTLKGMRELLSRLGLPQDYVQALSAQEASRHAGVVLHSPCWLYPGGGWVCPRDYIDHALATAGVSTRLGQPVQALRRAGPHWQLLGPSGQVLAQASHVVLANAQAAAPVLAGLGLPAMPLHRTRGQVSHWPTAAADRTLKLPLAGDGYAISLPPTSSGNGLTLCGATWQAHDEDNSLRSTDDEHNLMRFERLTGLDTPRGRPAPEGRVGWRLHSDDRLPLAGAVPAAHMEPGTRLDQCRFVPREPGLFMLTALGSRGLTWAPLLGRLVAAQITGTPAPLESNLADALDPARWTARAARAKARPAQKQTQTLT
jgi:tRNA 5-methylaminomethyl-2-thiouridine biosynthesis bifunctional protein